MFKKRKSSIAGLFGVMLMFLYMLDDFEKGLLPGFVHEKKTFLEAFISIFIFVSVNEIVRLIVKNKSIATKFFVRFIVFAITIFAELVFLGLIPLIIF